MQGRVDPLMEEDIDLRALEITKSALRLLQVKTLRLELRCPARPHPQPIQCLVRTCPKLAFSERHEEMLVTDKLLWAVGLMEHSGLCVNLPR